MALWVQEAARRHPDRPAIETPALTLTYDELARRAATGAAALGDTGLEQGEPVALMLAPGADFVIAQHAALLAGHPVVPIDLRLSEEERAQRRARTRVVISEPLSSAGPDPTYGADPTDGVSPTGGAGRSRSGGVTAQHPAAIMHTSGTTSAPKPVELSTGNFLASALGSAVALGLDPAERWLCPMPLTHVGGFSIPVRSAIYATTVVLHGRFDTGTVLAELMDPSRRITLVSLVPTMLARLLDAGLERPPTLRWALLGGGPIAPALLARAESAGVPVAPSYGMTEACSQIATFGFPLPGVELEFGEEQEILVRGAIVAHGALSADGWLHTGDLGATDERNRLVITGRRSDTIVTGGENVAPAEVEAVLLEHPGVADAGVFARADPEWGEIVVAKIVPRPGLGISEAELRAFCAERIARFKVPKAFELIDALPRTASGKLLRRELE